MKYTTFVLMMISVALAVTVLYFNDDSYQSDSHKLIADNNTHFSESNPTSEITRLNEHDDIFNQISLTETLVTSAEMGIALFTIRADFSNQIAQSKLVANGAEVIAGVQLEKVLKHSVVLNKNGQSFIITAINADDSSTEHIDFRDSALTANLPLDNNPGLEASTKPSTASIKTNPVDTEALDSETEISYRDPAYLEPGQSRVSLYTPPELNQSADFDKEQNEAEKTTEAYFLEPGQSRIALPYSVNQATYINEENEDKSSDSNGTRNLTPVHASIKR